MLVDNDIKYNWTVFFVEYIVTAVAVVAKFLCC